MEKDNEVLKKLIERSEVVVSSQKTSMDIPEKLKFLDEVSFPESLSLIYLKILNARKRDNHKKEE